MARNRVINNHLGNVYSFPLRIAGYILILMGLVAISTLGYGVFLGIVFVLAGVYFSLAAYGIDIDVESRSVRQYKSIAGLKFGKYIEYATYNNISIIRKNRKKTSPFMSDNNTSESPYNFEIYLVSRSHRGKVMLDVLNTREEAEEAASSYATALKATVVDYAPPGKAKKRSSGSREHHKEEGSHRKSSSSSHSNKTQSED